MADILDSPCTPLQDVREPILTMQQQTTTTGSISFRADARHAQCVAHRAVPCGHDARSGSFRSTAAQRGLFPRAAREAHGG